MLPERGVGVEGECGALSPYSSSLAYSGWDSLTGFLGWLCHCLVALGMGTKKRVTGYYGILHSSVEKQQEFYCSGSEWVSLPAMECLVLSWYEPVNQEGWLQRKPPGCLTRSPKTWPVSLAQQMHLLRWRAEHLWYQWGSPKPDGLSSKKPRMRHPGLGQCLGTRCLPARRDWDNWRR